jgi:chromosome segregation ATPase
MGSLRSHCESTLTAHATSIEGNKAKLLQCAQALEKQWSASKVAHQRVESLQQSQQLQAQQLRERIETINKQHSRWHNGLEETLKAIAADVQVTQAHSRTMEAAVSTTKAESRRMLGEHETEMQRQCDTLGRAIHSLADTLNLTSPLIASSPVPPSPQR